MNTLQIGIGWHAHGAGSGVDRVYNALSQTLPAEHVNVQGLVYGNGNASSLPGNIHQAASLSSPLPKRLWAGRRMAQRLFSSSHIDLVATHFSLYTLPILDLLADRPLVVHFHGPWALESAAEGESTLHVHMKKWVEQTVYRRGHRFIVLSQAFKDVLTTHYGVDPTAVRIVPGGVDTSRFQPSLSRREARKALGWDLDRPTVLAVRRLVHRVGVEELLEAAQTVAAAVPDVQILIAGKGSLQNVLTRRIVEMGLDNHVSLLGFVAEEDLPLAYRAADMSIVPTQALEGFGLVAVESLAAGTPTLVTPVGGLPEIVDPLSPSLVMDGTTPAAIATALIEALEGERPLPSPEVCRDYATTHYDWPVVARQIRDVYEEVLT